jgi:hypothetical protein
VVTIRDFTIAIILGQEKDMNLIKLLAETKAENGYFTEEV